MKAISAGNGEPKVVSALWRQRQEDYYKFEVIMINTATPSQKKIRF